MLPKITPHVTWDNRTLSFHSSGGKKSKLGITGPKSKRQPGCPPSGGCEENALHSLVTAAFHWFVAESLQSLPLWSHCLRLFCLISFHLILIRLLWLHLGSTEIIKKKKKSPISRSITYSHLQHFYPQEITAHRFQGRGYESHPLVSKFHVLPTCKIHSPHTNIP